MGFKSAYETGRSFAREEIELGHYTDRQDMALRAKSRNPYKGEKARADFEQGSSDWVETCLKHGWVTEPQQTPDQIQQQPEKRETCSRCHINTPYVDGAVTKDTGLYVCSFCAIHMRGNIAYYCHEYYDRAGNLLAQRTTLEEADTLVDEIGLTEQVEDHEQNERGHVYTLFDGSALVVTSPTTYYLTGRKTPIKQLERQVIGYMRQAIALYHTDPTCASENLAYHKGLFSGHLMQWSEAFSVLQQQMYQVWCAYTPQKTGRYVTKHVGIGYSSIPVTTWTNNKKQPLAPTTEQLLARFDQLVCEYTNTQQQEEDQDGSKH